MAVDINLSQEQVAEAEALARDTYEQFKDVHGHYPNKPNTHRVGKLAEFAAEQWLRDSGVQPDPAYRDVARWNEPDLIVDGGIEVKGWTSGRSWDEGGRCVRPQQIDGLRKKVRAVVWCRVTEQEGGEVLVTIEGWSTPDDVAQRPITMTGPAWPPLANHQVPVEDLRSPHDLVQELQIN